MTIPIVQVSFKEKTKFQSYLKRAKSNLLEATNIVLPIIKDVEQNGDKAVLQYTEKFDEVKLKQFVFEVKNLEVNIPQEVQEAFLKAKENIEAFHSLQIPRFQETIIHGNRLGFKFTPVDSVAVYAPGGKAFYPSSVLMGVIPAKLAGVNNISLVTPPEKNGELNPVLLYVAKICGVNNIITVGGAQAIAAVAFGTESIPKVDFVVGPGNRYVTAAKTYLASIGEIGIESPAGPSEVLIVADEFANPMWLACDMLSQAEHGEDSIAILATNSIELAKKVSEEIEKALKERPKRYEMKSNSIYKNSAIFVFPNIEECIYFSNEFAPEHLEIQTQTYKEDFEKIRHAGSVFLGEYSPVAMGDYISGTNHILPTAGMSRVYSSLGVDTFLKRVTYQEIQKDSLVQLYPYVKIMSEMEGLDEEHGTSVKVRTI